MNRKTVSVLLLAALILPVLFAAESDAEVSETYYSQLDANGKGLYDRMSQMFEDCVEDPSDSVSVSFSMIQPMFFGTTEMAQEYGDDLVRKTLVAMYLTNPYPIWLWDVPIIIDGLDVSKVMTSMMVGDSIWQSVESITFSLNVPENYSSDSGIIGISEALEELDSKLVNVQGTDVEKVEAINGLLRKVSVREDPEGRVSSIYDALVVGTASSAGVAAAFTLLCAINGVDSCTVDGYVQTTSGYSYGYWNHSIIDGEVRATDCTWNKTSEYQCLLVGYSTDVEGSSMISGHFSSTHILNNGAMDTSLIPSQLSEKGMDWSYRDGLFDKYGNSVMMVILGIIIVAALLYAVKTKNF